MLKRFCSIDSLKITDPVTLLPGRLSFGLSLALTGSLPELNCRRLRPWPAADTFPPVATSTFGTVPHQFRKRRRSGRNRRGPSDSQC